MVSTPRPVPVMTMVDGIGVSGGAEALALEVAQRLDRERFRPLVCITRWDPRKAAVKKARELEVAGVEMIALSRSSRFDLRPWSRLVRRMRSERSRPILHTHKFGSNVWGSLLAPLGGAAAFVAHEHTWSYEGSPVRQITDRWLIAARADAFVAVSAEDRRRMETVEGIPAGKIRFIPNGIPSLPASPLNRDVREELGIGTEQPVIGVVAGIREQKALDVLVRAAAEIRRTYPDLVVLIVGDARDGSPALTVLEKAIGELDLEQAVRILGHRSDVPSVLAALDVAVLSSDYEGSPLSIMEYMAVGKPVVATKVGGVPDLVEDGVTGLLVEPRDHLALARAISRLLSDPETAQAMGWAGQERQRRDFSIEATTQRIESLYVELLAAKER